MRRGAVDVIGKLTEYDDIRSKYVTQGIVTAVFNKLGDGNSDVRLGAVDVIGRLKQYENFCMMVTAPEIIALISEGCGASNPDIQQSFLGMLSILEKLDLTSMVLTTIVNKLNDSNHSIQTAIVAFTLFAEQEDLHIRSITPETIAAIITMMSHRDQAIQVSSIKILVNLSKYDHHHNLILATNVVEVTIDLLQSLNRDNRARAVQFLVNLRIASVKSPHFPRLISLFTDPNPEIVKSSLPILLQMAEQGLVFDNRTLQIWDAINRMLQEPRTGACAIQALKAFVMNATALHEIVYDSAIVPTLLRLLETRNSSGGELWHIGAEGLLILDKF
ncbi:ARM repeat-containing protein [Serendipita vermifera]|nr:ARM repeat-containing protein [Serendipita vermifera]